MLARYFVPVFFISIQPVTAILSLEKITSSFVNVPENGRLDSCALMNKYNYPCVKYEVITEDGYILTLFNVPGDKKKPVLLQHGFADSSDTWVIRGYNSLAACLSNNTYDVWLGNTRGNLYSRAHKTLNPDLLEFWEFSFHEMALYDMPAMINFILEKTGQTNLQFIAHSQGTTLSFILGSLKPEFSSKIKNVICLAPIAYLHNAQRPLFPLLSLGGSPLSAAVAFIGPGEILRNSSDLVAVFRTACTEGLVGYKACGEGVASVMIGSDPEQFEPEFATTALRYYPSGTSMKNAIHFLQIVAKKRFQQYDYGIENLRRYGSVQPPLYDLSKVPFNFSFYVGENDRLSDIEDVNHLRGELSHDVDYYVMPDRKWNHMDFTWGRSMPDYLFSPVLKSLIKYY